MRFTKTFIVHLYFDEDIPERLCGNIRGMEDPENHPFKSQTEFITVLHQLVRKPPSDQAVSLKVNSKPDE